MKRNYYLLLTLTLLFCLASCGAAKDQSIELMPLVTLQMDLGPRTPGSEAHGQFVTQVAAMLETAGWQVQCDEVSYQRRMVRNIIAERGADGEYSRWIVIGAHYDSRISADQERMPQDRQQAVPGANDGASGVAVLLGLAQTLPELPDQRITLAFFDAEDQGNVMGWPDWCLGSSALAEQYGALERKPDAVVVLDMIGDADLNIYRERNSDPALTDELFGIAKRLGYANQFLNTDGYAMYDDHIPFIEQGIPAADLIDFDYQWWHTLGDTADRLSEESLQAVYRVVFAYLTGK